MTQNSTGEGQRPRLYMRFESRKVFAAYIVCWSITFATLIASVVMYLVMDAHSAEKMIEHTVLCVVTLLLLHIPLGMHTKYNFRFPPMMHVTIALFIVAHFVLGEVYRFYDHIFFFDKTLHVTSGIVIAICGFSIVHAFCRTDDGRVRLSPLFLAMFSFCFSTTLLTLWEFLEYALDAVFSLNMMRWKDGLFLAESGTPAQTVIDGVTYWMTSARRGSGLVDTMNDLIVGVIGAVLISAVGGYWFRKNPDDTKYLIVRKNTSDKAK